jgi:hypothetical protein
MTDGPLPVAVEAPEPAPAPSSLSPAAADKQAIEAMMAQGPTGEYYRGNATMTAAQIQAHYADILRGELAGADMPMGPDHRDDVDVPGKASGYSLDNLHIYDAPTRDIVDTFARHAHDGGFGNERFRSVVTWALQQSGPPSRAEFLKWAQGEHWPDTMIKRALEIYGDMRRSQA